MSTLPDAREPERGPQSVTDAVLAPGHTFASVTDKISAIVLARGTPRGWWLGFGLSFALVTLLMVSITYLIAKGVGIWGINIPVAWGFAILIFVWWIGIGHAGTLISAVLLLFNQPWRTSINRFAEAMTLFAVACAGLYPLLHLGRIWVFYWLLPYPNTMGVWPQFRSALVWDVFAVSTYLTVSLLFWYVGLIPDLATLRDRTESRVGRVILAILHALPADLRLSAGDSLDIVQRRFRVLRLFDDIARAAGRFAQPQRLEFQTELGQQRLPPGAFRREIEQGSAHRGPRGFVARRDDTGARSKGYAPGTAARPGARARVRAAA
jgi:molybdopterin-containing oxidoreductase family membrane subunit